MVAVEDILRDFLIRKHGGKPEYIDINVSLPAGTSLTYTYTVPSGYVWFKIDTRHGTLPNRAFQLTLIMDESVLMQNLSQNLGFLRESYRCIGVGSVVYNKITAVIRNADNVTRTYDCLIRAFLLPEIEVIPFIEDMQTVYLSKQDRKILEDIRDCLIKALKK